MNQSSIYIDFMIGNKDMTVYGIANDGKWVIGCFFLGGEEVKSPIKNKIKTVFIPISNIKAAIQWYSEILNIPTGDPLFEHLFVAEMEGTDMVLDMLPNWRDQDGKLPVFRAPYIQFGTEDIHASYQYMKDKGVELVTVFYL